MKNHFQRQSKANPSTKFVKEKVATNWMRNRGKEIHSAFEVDSQYDPPRERYIPNEQAAIKYSNPSLAVCQICLLIHLLAVYRNL